MPAGGITWGIEGSEDAFSVAGLLRAGANQASDTKFVMDKIVSDMLRVEKMVFRAQGRRGGGSWKPLAPDTIRKKGTANILRTDLARPGYSKIDGSDSSDSLYRSLTEVGAPYQILEVSRDTIRFGTDRPYAGTHQYGSWLRFIPARPFMQVLPEDINRWTRMIGEHLMRPFVRGDKKEVK